MFTNIPTLGQVLPLIPSQSCMHMGWCAKGRFGARAHEAISYELVDRLGKIKQARQKVLHALYVPYPFGSRPIWLLASKTSLGTTAIFRQILEEKSSFQETIFWNALNCMEPSLSWLRKQKWPRVVGFVGIILSLLCSCSQVHKVSNCALFSLVFCAPMCAPVHP